MIRYVIGRRQTTRQHHWSPPKHRRALKHLQSQYGFGSNYVLAGHSVGATLAFLATLQCSDNNIPPPRTLSAAVKECTRFRISCV